MRIIKKKKFELLNRRLFIFGAFKVLSITFILERLYKMQIKQSEKYKKLAENNRINNNNKLISSITKKIIKNKITDMNKVILNIPFISDDIHL